MVIDGWWSEWLWWEGGATRAFRKMFNRSKISWMMFHLTPTGITQVCNGWRKIRVIRTEHVFFLPLSCPCLLPCQPITTKPALRCKNRTPRIVSSMVLVRARRREELKGLEGMCGTYIVTPGSFCCRASDGERLWRYHSVLPFTQVFLHFFGMKARFFFFHGRACASSDFWCCASSRSTCEYSFCCCCRTFYWRACFCLRGRNKDIIITSKLHLLFEIIFSIIDCDWLDTLYLSHMRRIR